MKSIEPALSTAVPPGTNRSAHPGLYQRVKLHTKDVATAATLARGKFQWAVLNHAKPAAACAAVRKPSDRAAHTAGETFAELEAPAAVGQYRLCFQEARASARAVCLSLPRLASPRPGVCCGGRRQDSDASDDAATAWRPHPLLGVQKHSPVRTELRSNRPSICPSVAFFVQANETDPAVEQTAILLTVDDTSNTTVAAIEPPALQKGEKTAVTLLRGAERCVAVLWTCASLASALQHSRTSPHFAALDRRCSHDPYESRQTE